MQTSIIAPRGAFRLPVTIVIVCVWVALMGRLFWDRYSPGASTEDHGYGISAVEADDWFIIRIGGAFSGVGRSRQFRTGADWTLRDEVNLSLNLQGRVKPLRILHESKVDENYRLISFAFKLSSGIISFEQKGRMDGRELVLEPATFQGGGSRRIRLTEAPRISRSLGLPVPLTGLAAGDRIQMPIFDPLDGSKSEATVRVLERADLKIAGKKIDGWRVRAEFKSAYLTMWIDDEGRLLKGSMPLGITVVRSDRPEIEQEMKSVRELPDLVALTAVPVEGTLPDMRNLAYLRVEIGTQGGWIIPNDGLRQTLTGSEITIRKEPLPSASYSLPCEDPKMAEHLKASRFIQSDQPEVIAAAREIVGQEKDPVKAAALINTWVYRNLKKVPTPSVPDAHTVLLTKQGDCNEHSILSVALARAVGMPSRAAVGLVQMGNEFYYHSWVAFWDGKNWFTADPMMNQMPADPSHIALVYGDVDKHVNVLAFLGRLRLKVLEAG